jgi:hypothetical protein
LRVYAHVCAYMHVRMCVLVCTCALCVHVCELMCVLVCARVHMYLCVLICVCVCASFARVCFCVHMTWCACVYSCVCACVYSHMCSYACVCIYPGVHVCAHAYAYVSAFMPLGSWLHAQKSDMRNMSAILMVRHSHHLLTFLGLVLVP